MKETSREPETLLSPTDASVVRLLAEHEEILRLVEQIFPVKVYARGSSLSIKGDDGQLVKKIENLLVQYAELLAVGTQVQQRGDPLRAAQHRTRRDGQPPLALQRRRLHKQQGQGDTPLHERTERLRPRDTRERHNIRHRPRRHGQDIFGRGAGRRIPQIGEGEPHNTCAPCVVEAAENGSAIFRAT